MATPRQITSALVILAALVVVVFGVSVLKNRRANEALTGPTIRSSDPSRGLGSAAVTIVEFGDFACPFCKENAGALARLLNEFPNDIRHVWKDFPLPEHGQALSAALSARCAARQGKFWEYHDALFQRQPDLGPDLYPVIASDLGLDFSAFSRCTEEEQTRSAVEQSVVDGQLLSVTRVPTLWLNDQRFDETLAFDDLRALVQAELVAAQ
ncbi:MAG: thioredoxin domain-containing protein [Candidatus Kerfeldbacteria bacterium]|nr:thioredoxin domain-containing protein [Candidatus Kerfeldbacteria bacterium]